MSRPSRPISAAIRSAAPPALTIPLLTLALATGCASHTATTTVNADTSANSVTPAPSPSAPAASDAPVRDALEASGRFVRLYDQHIDTLANPFMQGRLPGTEGIARAEQYIMYYMQAAGLRPAFTDSSGSPSFFQDFPAGARTEVREQSLTIAANRGNKTYRAGMEFNAIGFSGSGSAEGELAFVGFGIEEGPDGYSSFGGEDDLTGKIAVMARFEPMNAEGRSAWGNGSWTDAASLNGKFAAVAERNPAGIIFFTPSQADDSRVGRLESVNSISGWDLGVPVIHMDPGELERAITQGSNTTLERLISNANREGRVVALPGVTATITTQLERDPVIARNVGGVIPGAGELADEWIIIGGHHDHLGPGQFGSRTPNRFGEIHIGADDNASGTAGVLVTAEMLAEAYADMPADQPRRSVLLMTFSAEESGLNGARYFVENPTMPLEAVQCMLNMDMIGRIKDNRLSLSGLPSAEGWADELAPILDASPLTVVTPTDISGRSDHWPFYTRQIPVLFGIIADFHDDYHTPDDVAWKINRTGATHTARLMSDIAIAMATRADKLVYNGLDPDRQVTTAAAPMARVKVRFGISPGSYGMGADPGILVGDVYPGTSAAEAGIIKGDRMTKWGDTDIPTVEAWMPMLSQHEPGDIVEVTLVRNGETLVVPVTLQARSGGG